MLLGFLIYLFLAIFINHIKIYPSSHKQKNLLDNVIKLF